MIDRAIYDCYGYVVVPSVLSSDEIEQCRVELERLSELIEADPDNHTVRTFWHPSADDPDRCVKQIEPFIDLSPLFQKIAADPRLTEVAAAAFGESVVLFEDKVMVKPPGGSGFPWHQDWSCCWRAHSDQAATCFLYLDDPTTENGALQVIPGSHKSRECVPFAGEGHFGVDTTQIDIEAAVMPDLRAGDMILFDSYLLHHSGPNLSDEWRRTLIYTYTPVSVGEHNHYDTSSGEVRWVSASGEDLYHYDPDSAAKGTTRWRSRDQ